MNTCPQVCGALILVISCQLVQRDGAGPVHSGNKKRVFARITKPPFVLLKWVAEKFAEVQPENSARPSDM
jgi:hypothetical protein